MSRTTMNRIHNATNPNQGDAKKVLCLCSAGLLRSPTMAVVLSQEPFNFNTRAAGVTESYALVFADEVLIHWADEIVCVERDVFNAIKHKIPPEKSVVVLNVPDRFEYRDPRLVEEIVTQYTRAIATNLGQRLDADEL